MLAIDGVAIMGWFCHQCVNDVESREMEMEMEEGSELQFVQRTSNFHIAVQTECHVVVAISMVQLLSRLKEFLRLLHKRVSMVSSSCDDICMCRHQLLVS